MPKYILIDDLYPEVTVFYGPFDDEEEAKRFAVALDTWYLENDPDFGKGWKVAKLVEPDWDQFGK